MSVNIIPVASSVAMSDCSPEEGEVPEQTLEVTITPEHQGGVWSNFARVNHSPHEFTIDFVRIDFAHVPLSGVVVARVGLSPLFVRQLIDTLEDNWQKYANKALPKEVRGDDDQP